MSTEALWHYAEAKDALRGGDRKTAAEHLALALGSQPENPIISGQVETLLNHQGLAGEMILDLLRVEVSRRKKHGS